MWKRNFLHACFLKNKLTTTFDTYRKDSLKKCKIKTIRYKKEREKEI